MPLFGAAVVRTGVELAGGHLGFPVRAPELVLDDLPAVEPVLDVRSFGDDARLVPLAHRLHGVGGRRIQLVRRAGEMVRPLVVGGLEIVEELIFRRAPLNVVVLLGTAVEDAAVARFADLPLDFQFEVPELVLRHDVLDRGGLGQRAVNDRPALRNGLRLVAPPGGQRLAVEQGLPEARLWSGRGGAGGENGAEHERDRTNHYVDLPRVMVAMPRRYIMTFAKRGAAWTRRKKAYRGGSSSIRRPSRARALQSCHATCWGAALHLPATC